jgi:hypothetical protein
VGSPSASRDVLAQLRQDRTVAVSGDLNAQPAPVLALDVPNLQVGSQAVRTLPRQAARRAAPAACHRADAAGGLFRLLGHRLGHIRLQRLFQPGPVLGAQVDGPPGALPAEPDLLRVAEPSRSSVTVTVVCLATSLIITIASTHVESPGRLLSG